MPARLRSSLRYAPAHGAFPTVVGWPFAWIEVAAETLTFSTGRLVPGGVRWTVNRSDITRIEATQHGLRFYAAGIPEPWVTASLFPRHFLKRLKGVGIEPNAPMRPTKWNTI
ncbi:MAG: hypothetical protein ACYDES_13160 [Acidimicrobiales bacterium]